VYVYVHGEEEEEEEKDDFYKRLCVGRMRRRRISFSQRHTAGPWSLISTESWRHQSS
jgi:hypothetical protein